MTFGNNLSPVDNVYPTELNLLLGQYFHPGRTVTHSGRGMALGVVS